MFTGFLLVSRSQTILRARRLSMITDGAYNRNIDERLARNMVWLRETRFLLETNVTVHFNY